MQEKPKLGSYEEMQKLADQFIDIVIREDYRNLLKNISSAKVDPQDVVMTLGVAIEKLEGPTDRNPEIRQLNSDITKVGGIMGGGFVGMTLGLLVFGPEAWSSLRGMGVGIVVGGIAGRVALPAVYAWETYSTDIKIHKLVRARDWLEQRIKTSKP